MASWYWSKAANLLAYSMARSGSSVNEIVAALENAKWLTGKAALACALSNWHAIKEQNDRSKSKGGKIICHG